VGYSDEFIVEFAGETILKICEHLVKLHARSDLPTTYHLLKAFCCNIFSSASQQMRTVILWEFYYGHSVYLLVSELNNAKMTVRNFNNCSEWLNFARQVAS